MVKKKSANRYRKSSKEEEEFSVQIGERTSEKATCKSEWKTRTDTSWPLKMGRAAMSHVPVGHCPLELAMWVI